MWILARSHKAFIAFALWGGGLLLSCGPRTPARHDTPRPKAEPQLILTEGTHLLYLIKVNEKVRYNLEVEFTMVVPEHRFNFFMNNMDFTFGSVFVAHDALKNADSLLWQFPDGHSYLKGKTALRLSTAQYENIVTRRTCQVALDDNPLQEFYLIENEDCSFELDSIHYTTSCMVLQNKAENIRLHILRNVNYPFVVRLEQKDGPTLQLLQWKNPSPPAPSSGGESLW
ncbi:MAG: hypothetical protein N2110_06450 [Flavobacteriales bacterium]|nr:hypothetical protein [Flavobacteriales bacterium]MCX7768643.1 hypothetical protein [Flavobacteriales bacterium]MDW8410367.1 hypothetical protein [Flavobacteriales bacterium]